MINLPLSDETIQSLSPARAECLKICVRAHGVRPGPEHPGALRARLLLPPPPSCASAKSWATPGFAEFKYALRAARRESGGQEAAPSPRPARSSDLMIDLLNSNIQGHRRPDPGGTASAHLPLLRQPHAPSTSGPPGGITDTTGEYLERLLLSTGRQSVYRIESARLFSHLINTVGKDSLMVLISTSGTFGNTIRIGKLAQMKGLPILSITPYTSNEIADLSTVSFRFFTDQRENLGAEYTSRLPIFFTIHTIIQCYIRYREERESRQEGGSHDSTV